MRVQWEGELIFFQWESVHVLVLYNCLAQVNIKEFLACKCTFITYILNSCVCSTTGNTKQRITNILAKHNTLLWNCIQIVIDFMIINHILRSYRGGYRELHITFRAVISNFESI